MLAISTVWRSRKSVSGKDLIDEMRKLPINGLELEFRIPPLMYEEMIPCLHEGRISIVSLHNYFPVPDILLPSEGSGDAFLLSSDDEDERELAVKYSKKTLRIAKELGVANVIFHLGLIPIEYTKRSIMEALVEEARKGSQNSKLLNKVIDMRESAKGRYLSNCLNSLEELFEEAERLSVTICLENRFYPTEMPNLEEMTMIFERYKGAPVKYWHDVGHAVVQDRLGFDTNDDLIRENVSRMAGVHLHDVFGFKDHLAPGSGEVDFKHIKSVLPEGIFQVIEVHEQATATELVRSIEYLQSLGY